MFEMIPNWHPFFVAFSIGLFTTATIFFWVAYFSSRYALGQELEIAGRWVLWTCALFTLFTAITGLQAFNSVYHDEAGHQAITVHRNWGLVAAAAVLFLSFWILWNRLFKQNTTILFLIVMLIGQGIVLCTGWYGMNVVFRHGIGVEALPQPGYHHHEHEEP